MTTPYEQLTSEDYWQHEQEMPKYPLSRRVMAELPVLRGIADAEIYLEVSKVERNITLKQLGRLGTTQTVALDSQYKTLPSLDKFGFFKLQIDRRKPRKEEPEWLIDSAAEADFNSTAELMRNENYMGARATAFAANPDGGFFEVSRSIVYARSSKQRILGFEASELTRKWPARDYALPEKTILPNLEVQTVYSSGEDRLKISYAEQTTPLNQSNYRKR